MIKAYNTKQWEAWDILNGRKMMMRQVIKSRNAIRAKDNGYCKGNGLWIDASTDNGDHAGNPPGEGYRGKESERHPSGIKFGKGKEGVVKWIETRYI